MSKPKQKSEWRQDWVKHIRNVKLIHHTPPMYAEKTMEDRRDDRIFTPARLVPAKG